MRAAASGGKRRIGLANGLGEPGELILGRRRVEGKASSRTSGVDPYASIRYVCWADQPLVDLIPDRMRSATSRFIFALTPAVVTLLVILVALNTTRALNRSSVWVDHTRLVMQTADAVRISAMQGESDQYRFALTGDTAAERTWQLAGSSALAGVAKLRQLTADNPRQAPRLDALAEELRGRFPAAATMAPTGAATVKASPLPGASLGHMARVRSLLDEISGDESQLLVVREQDAAGRVRTSTLVLVIGGLLAVIIAVFVNLTLSRIIGERERMMKEIGAQLGDLTAMRRELDARSPS